MKNNIFAATLAICLLGFGFYFGKMTQEQEEKPITAEQIQAAANVIGLDMTQAEIDSLLEGVSRNRNNYMELRKHPLPNSVPPALNFNPVPVGFEFEKTKKPLVLSKPKNLAVPDQLEKLAFWSVRDLAELIRTRKITSMQLTQMYLGRLKKHGPTLEAVITLTEERALAAARRADEEIAAGKYRGLLHGIPYGAKDLLSTKGYKTTWGAMPYKDQMIDEDATVIKKLDEAGAVLVAKTTLGALAMGDVWYGGTTKNPWNLEQGSSGSSAGSASTTAAGLVAFSIGTETLGSIVSPSTRCGVTGLRPTYGRVSRTSAMALSWSMDKVGPICRTVEDCAIVFNAIIGPDGIDQTLIDVPFNYNANTKLSDLRIGYVKSLFERESRGSERDSTVLEVLRSLGVKLVPIELPDFPYSAMRPVLSAEAAAAFDALTRSGDDDALVRQGRNAWPNAFRTARFIPAVEYIQGNRVRYQLVQEMQKVMAAVDVYVSPSYGGPNLLLTNLTSHPCVVLPNGFTDAGSPTSITFIGGLYNEAAALRVAKAYQDATDWHLRHPAMFE